jgi:hypothetical protein
VLSKGHGAEGRVQDEAFKNLMPESRPLKPQEGDAAW